MGNSRAYDLKGVKNSYRFGIDRVGGLFVSIFNDEMPTKNFTQICPFDERLTVQNLQEFIPAEDLNLIRQQEIEELLVIFELGATEGFNGEMAEVLLNHGKGKHDFECSTFGDLLDAHSHFTEEVFYLTVTFAASEPEDSIELENDAVEVFI